MYAKTQFRWVGLVGFIVAAWTISGSAVPLQAQGIIISPPGDVPPIRTPDMPDVRLPRRPIHSWMPFSIKSERVDVAINDAVAETTVEQVFVNRGHRAVEGTYLFPIAENAALDKFSMWMNGREVSAELLDAGRAREIYQSIVAKMRDPALLEYTGRGLIRANVFPIPVGGECQVKLRYSEPIRSDGGMSGYRFPLGVGECGNQPIERLSIRATVRTARPLASVFSPSHPCSIDRRGDREAVIAFEATQPTDHHDFQLCYKTGEDPFGLLLLTHRGFEGDGFFMARLSPHAALGDGDVAMPKDICFVLDVSGSMADDNKIAQAKKALKFCITNLGREDRFGLITFSTEVRQFNEDLSLATDAARESARSFVDGLSAVGGTDIDAAMRQAVGLRRDDSGAQAGVGGDRSSRPYFIVLITDGEPTVGVTEPQQILRNVGDQNAAVRARVFVLGVGFTVNTKLLDRMADDNGGARDYVTPSEDLELKLSAFYTKLANPILADVSLAFKGVSVYDVYPKKLPDLFSGTELVVLGRYGGLDAASQEIELSGRARGEMRTQRYPCSFPRDLRENDYLPRLWAARKIGYLLDELRLHGDSREVREEVIRLSKQYGIMTPYTSFLVMEDEQTALRFGRAPVGAAPLGPRLRTAYEARRGGMDAAREEQVASVGPEAVAGSKDNRLLQSLGNSGDVAMQLEGFDRDANGRQLINNVGPKTFYRDGDRWVDSTFDGKQKPVQLRLFSKEYNDFLAANSAAGKFLAQGERVVLCWAGQAYETVPADVP